MVQRSVIVLLVASGVLVLLRELTGRGSYGNNSLWNSRCSSGLQDFIPDSVTERLLLPAMDDESAIRFGRTNHHFNVLVDQCLKRRYYNKIESEYREVIMILNQTVDEFMIHFPRFNRSERPISRFIPGMRRGILPSKSTSLIQDPHLYIGLPDIPHLQKANESQFLLFCLRGGEIKSAVLMQVIPSGSMFIPVAQWFPKESFPETLRLAFQRRFDSRLDQKRIWRMH